MLAVSLAEDAGTLGVLLTATSMDPTERKKQESKLRREASRKSALQPTSTLATDGVDDAPAKRKARKARKGSGPESRTFGGLSGMLEDINITELPAQMWTAAPWLAGFLAFAVQNPVVRLLLLAFVCWRCDGVTKAQWLGSRLGMCAPPPAPEVVEAADALNAGAASDADGSSAVAAAEAEPSVEDAAAAAAAAAERAEKRREAKARAEQAARAKAEAKAVAEAEARAEAEAEARRHAEAQVTPTRSPTLSLRLSLSLSLSLALSVSLSLSLNLSVSLTLSLTPTPSQATERAQIEALARAAAEADAKQRAISQACAP